MHKKLFAIGVQLIFSLLAFVAIAVQLTRHVSNNLSILNFFSYFTNLSNLIAAIVMLGGVMLFRNKKGSLPYDTLRGASVLGMAIVGIVFSVLLRNEDLGLLLPWVNVVLHYIMPVVVVAFWFINPPDTKISRRQAMYWLLFPLAYLAYSLIRGAIVHWYAYPFINPSKSDGYAGVVLYCVAILVAFLVCIALLLLVNKRAKRIPT